MEQLPSDIEGVRPPNGFVPDKETAMKNPGASSWVSSLERKLIILAWSIPRSESWLTTFSVVVKFPEQAPGYGPRLPIKIAEAVWLPIYGRSVLTQKPYEVTLIDEKIWIVEGTIRGSLARGGGTAYIEIDKYTGAILKVIHTK